MRQTSLIGGAFQSVAVHTGRVGRLGTGITRSGDQPTADATESANGRLDVIQIRTIRAFAEVVIAALLEEECSS